MARRSYPVPAPMPLTVWGARVAATPGIPIATGHGQARAATRAPFASSTQLVHSRSCLSLCARDQSILIALPAPIGRRAGIEYLLPYMLACTREPREIQRLETVTTTLRSRAGSCQRSWTPPGASWKLLGPLGRPPGSPNGSSKAWMRPASLPCRCRVIHLQSNQHWHCASAKRPKTEAVNGWIGSYHVQSCSSRRSSFAKLESFTYVQVQS